MNILTDENNTLKITDEGARHIFVRYKDFDEEVPMHWHSFYELEIIVDGVGRHVLNGEEYDVQRGSAYLLTTTDFHTLKNLSPMKIWHLSFDEEMLSEKRICELASGSVQKRFQLDGQTMEKLCALLSILSTETADENGCARELCEALLTILLRGAEKSPLAARENLGGINKALLYMNLHFRENPTLKTVAQQAGLHPNYFSELFREVTGESFVAKLNSLKIAYAKTLLRSGFSVSDACYRSGFGSLSNFLATFKRIVGCTPQNYRNEIRL